MNLKVITTAIAIMSLSGCGTLNSAIAERQESVEIYHIWDVKTSASPNLVIKALADGITRNTNSINTSRPLMKQGALPQEPGRFEVVDVGASLQGTGMGAIIAMSGRGQLATRIAKCDGAMWTSQATRDITGSNHLRLYTCLYAYKGGYHINQYGVFTKQSGGVMQIAREASQAIIGTPEEWLNKTVIDSLRAVQKAAGVEPKYLEGQPELGALPGVDSLDS